MEIKAMMGYWPVITAVFAGAVAWGGQQVQIQNLKEAQIQQVQIQAKQATIEAQAARVDERTKLILDAQQRQERMLQILIEKVQ
jgi:hypothetical protein